MRRSRYDSGHEALPRGAEEDPRGKYVTTKKVRKSHGLGLSSVEQAAEAYHGQVDADGRDGVFRVSVVMYGGEGQK